MNPPDNLTILPGQFLPISTDSAVDVVNMFPFALTAGAITLCAKVFKVPPNVNRDVPIESTKLWSPGVEYVVAVILLTVINDDELNVACLLFNRVSDCVFV